jgi:hypothetical protein
MKFLILSLFLLALSPCGAHNVSSVCKTPSMEVQTVAFCDLIRQPELYDHKTVRVTAIYRYGAEWSQLYCLDCITAGATWVDLDDSFAKNTDSKLAKKIGENGFRGRTVRVVAVGEFYGSGGRYGHMGSYRYKFQMSRLEQATIILNDSPIPAKLPKKVLKRARC